MEPLKREAFARTFNAVPIDQPIGGSVGPADEMGSVFAQQLARSTIERNREMPAEVSIRPNRPGFVTEHEGHDRQPAVVVTEICGPDDPSGQLVRCAYEDLRHP